MLLHSLKKKVNLHTKSVETSAEFQLYKNLLERVKKNLTTASKALETSNGLWFEQFKSHRDFSSAFASGYVPASETDNVDEAAREFADASSARHTRYVRETGLETAAYHRIHASVKEYLKEIETLEATYTAVVAAKSEADRYQSKVDSIEKSKKVKDEKKSRNLDKQDNCREKYEATLSRTLAAQKAVYAKAPLVSQMALTSYWLAQTRQMEIMEATMESTRSYALANEKDMCAINVAAIDVDLNNVSLTKSLPVPSSLPSPPKTLPPPPSPGSSEVQTSEIQSSEVHSSEAQSSDVKVVGKPTKHRFLRKSAS